MKISVFTLFPELFPPYLDRSILQRAIGNQIAIVDVINIREFAEDRHHTTDDTPYGGGGGMVMKPEPIFSAIETTLGSPSRCPVILMTPQGKPFDQETAYRLSRQPEIALVCGRYEGIDERIREHIIDEEISIGDFVLTGGELPALMIIDAVVRLLPGALGDPTGAEDDSFASGLLEYPHYTRPLDFRGWQIPDVLLSGNHAEINKWRRIKSLERTALRRPDLLKNASLTSEEKKWLDQFLISQSTLFEERKEK